MDSSEIVSLITRVILALHGAEFDLARQLAERLPEHEPFDAVRALARFRDRHDPGPLPAESQLGTCIQGWTLYYRAAYEEAGACFATAWERGDAWAAWAALGAGKVCSDLGRWDAARGWLLAAMGIARRQGDRDRVAECAGALAEVFARAGHPNVALELIGLDAGLLPAGSGYRGRLENYRAVCLGQLGQARMAENLLWCGYHDRSPLDRVSHEYSQTSLAILSVRSQDQSLWQRVSRYPGPQTVALARGFWSVVSAFWHACSPGDGDEQGVSRLLEEAILRFGDAYPIERLWARALAGHSGLEDEVQHLEVRAAPGAPDGLDRFWSAVDRHLGAIDLADSLDIAGLARAELKGVPETSQVFWI